MTGAKWDDRPSRFKDRLTWLMSRYDMSNKEIAEACGVSENAVSSWVNDKRTPMPYNLRKVADYLGVNPRWLLTGEGRMRTCR